ncbi:MAG: hypothetical protein R2762_22440 [Bryobacteraceae bacterium]
MRYAASNITTVLLLVLTIWTLVVRYKGRPDTNWPLIYYLLLVLYHQSIPGGLNSFSIYVGVISALFLRFEFMAGFFRYLFLTVEAAVMFMILYGLWLLIYL